MSHYETIRLRTDPRGIAQLTLARPAKHNALNAAMIREVTAAAALIDADPSIRAVVLEGEGRSFCAGGDLEWMKEQAAQDREGRMAGATLLAAMLRALDNLTKPLIGRVQGNAFGGGIGMMAVCDIVVAAEGAEFALTETRLGLIPATIGPYVIGRIGEGAARRLFLNAHRFDAAAAQHYGLVSRIASGEALDHAIEQEAAAFLACAPGAVAQAKKLIQTLARAKAKDPFADSTDALAERWESDEAKNGIAAFLARQPMPWADG